MLAIPIMCKARCCFGLVFIGVGVVNLSQGQ